MPLHLLSFSFYLLVSELSLSFYTFDAAKKLTVTRPATQICYGALYNCSMLQELTIAGTVTGIGGGLYNLKDNRKSVLDKKEYK